MEELNKMMIQTFNDGYEQLIMPRFKEMEELVKETNHKLKKELKEEFKAAQQSLSNRLETVERKMDQMDLKMDNLESKMDEVITENKNNGKRLDKVERIVKAN